MDATIMPSTFSLLALLKQDNPTLVFKKGEQFQWSPDERTIYYANTTDHASLLHEVAHAALGHTRYRRDIELLKIERSAWDYVTATLVKKYNLVIDDKHIEDALDTYRNWLHDRSLCPNCGATGAQTAPRLYICPACTSEWRVNEARLCALRRYIIQ